MFPLECEGEIRVRARTLNLLFFVVGTHSHSDRGLEILVSVEGRTMISSRRSECEFYCPKTCGNTNRISCARDQWRMGCVPREICCVVHAATIKTFPSVCMTLADIVTCNQSASSYSDRLFELMRYTIVLKSMFPRDKIDFEAKATIWSQYKWKHDEKMFTWKNSQIWG